MKGIVEKGGTVKAWLQAACQPVVLRGIRLGLTGLLFLAVGLFLMAFAVAANLSKGYFMLPAQILTLVRESVAYASVAVAGLAMSLMLLHAWVGPKSEAGRAMAFGVLTLFAARLATAILGIIGVDHVDGQTFGIRQDRVYWCGAIGLDTQDGVVSKLAAAKANGQRDITLVLMANGGGHAQGAIRLASRLAELGVTKVEAVGHCNSACALLWVLAPHRALSEYSTLGFHAPFDFAGVPVAADGELQIKAMVAAGFKKEAAQRLMRFGKYEMAYLTADSPELAGVSFERVPRQIEVDRKACDE